MSESCNTDQVNNANLMRNSRLSLAVAVLFIGIYISGTRIEQILLTQYLYKYESRGMNFVNIKFQHTRLQPAQTDNFAAPVLIADSTMCPGILLTRISKSACLGGEPVSHVRIKQMESRDREKLNLH